MIPDEVLSNYYPKIPYRVEICKDFLVKFGIKPTCRNGLMLCYVIEKGIA